MPASVRFGLLGRTEPFDAPRTIVEEKRKEKFPYSKIYSHVVLAGQARTTQENSCDGNGKNRRANGLTSRASPVFSHRAITDAESSQQEKPEEALEII